VEFSQEALFALMQVLMIDLVLAGDNAIVIGMVASRVAPENRPKVIMWGLVAAVVMRIGFALITVQLLAIIGLMFAGGLLLLWVAWRLYRDIRAQEREKAGIRAAEAATDNRDTPADHVPATGGGPMSMKQAVFQVAVADVSMSLDNVLAVAGAAHDHPYIMAFGLAVAIMLMGVAATYVARLLHKYHWLSYLGLALILYVALSMMYEGSHDFPALMTQLGM
jgi:YjbE family integral membrane protein